MPAPRQEDDDWFPREDDIDLGDGDETPKKAQAEKKKTAKKKAVRKTVSKGVADTVAPKKKKTVKRKKAVRSEDPSDSSGDPPPIPRNAFGDPVEEEPAAPRRRPGRPSGSRSASAAPAESTQERSELPPRDWAEDDSQAPGATAQADDRRPPAGRSRDPDAVEALPEEPNGDADEYGRPKPIANYVVHVYEFGRLKRTIDREFTPEDAEAYATEFTRTARNYGRRAVAGKKDTAPPKTVEGR